MEEDSSSNPIQNFSGVLEIHNLHSYILIRINCEAVFFLYLGWHMVELTVPSHKGIPADRVNRLKKYIDNSILHRSQCVATLCDEKASAELWNLRPRINRNRHRKQGRPQICNKCIISKVNVRMTYES